MAGPVGDYHEATVSLGRQTSDSINSLELTVGIVVAAAAITYLFSVGASGVAAAVEVDGAVTSTLEAIQTAYQASKMPTILGLAALGGGVSTILDAFHAIPHIDLDKAATNLATLIAMKVIVGIDGAMTVPTSASDSQGVADWQKEVAREAADDIAHGHADGKHAGDFPGKSADEVADEVKSIVDNPRMEKPLSRGRAAFSDGKTVVIYDPQSPDGGTVFKPGNIEDYWDSLK